METRVKRSDLYITHEIKIPEEDVEARYFIPKWWRLGNPNYIFLAIRHENYICVCKIVEGKIGNSATCITDSWYPAKKRFKLPFSPENGLLKAEEMYPQIIDVLLSRTYTSGLAIRYATAKYRYKGYARECMSAFADLTMDFEIMGPILEYCEGALATYKSVEGIRTEVSADGGGDPSPNPDTPGNTAGISDADQDRRQDQEEQG